MRKLRKRDPSSYGGASLPAGKERWGEGIQIFRLLGGEVEQVDENE